MKKKIWISVIAFILAVTTLCLASCSGMPKLSEIFHKEKTDETVTPEGTQKDDVASIGGEEYLSISDCENLRLLAGPTIMRSGVLAANAPAGASVNYFERVLTATVLPIDAPDKRVDWSIAWADNAAHKDEPISNYITLTPTTDGANTASVKCFKGFEGDVAIITVTTRIGGYTATCRVGYRGAPTSLTIDNSDQNISTDYDWDMDMTFFMCGTTTTLDILPDNLIHAVGSTFHDYDLKIETYGSILVDTRVHTTGSTEDTHSTSTQPLTAANIFDTDGYCYAYIPKNGGLLSVARFEIQDGKLVIQAQDSLSSYYGISGGRGGYSEQTYIGYSDSKAPYIKVTVTEKTSGVSAVLNIQTIATVSSVNLSDTEFDF